MGNWNNDTKDEKKLVTHKISIFFSLKETKNMTSYGKKLR